MTEMQFVFEDKNIEPDDPGLGSIVADAFSRIDAMARTLSEIVGREVIVTGFRRQPDNTIAVYYDFAANATTFKENPHGK